MWHRENFIGMNFYFVDVTRGFLLMHKLGRITHKLSIAQKGFMLSFWMIRQLTYQWIPQKQLIPYNPNFVAEIVRFFIVMNFFGAYGKKIVPRFLHRNLLKSKKIFQSIILQKNRHNDGNLRYYKFSSLFNLLINCCHLLYLVTSLLVVRAGYGICLYQFLIIAYLFIFLYLICAVYLLKDVSFTSCTIYIS